MGNRATVAFASSNIRKDKLKQFPAVYLHWNGGPESIYAFLDYMKSKGCRMNDPSYAMARFTQIVGNFMGGTLSLGIETYLNVEHAIEDNGFYLVTPDIDTDQGYKVDRAFNGPTDSIRWLTDEEVEREAKEARSHEYWTNEEESIMQNLMKINDPIFDRKE